MTQYSKILKHSVSALALNAGRSLVIHAVTVLCFTIHITTQAYANPEGGTVVGGSATITQPNSTTVQINQSTQNAIINWNSFNVGTGETTQFYQPSINSWTLNRVTGSQNPSQILGTVTANGNIAIINPDGILFGRNARIDVGGLLATTHDIRNSDFMAGRMNFTLPGNPTASIVNLGNISVRDQGVAAFVAPGVRNAGVITARLGKVNLTAANGFSLDMYGDDLITLMVGDEITREIIDVATGKPITDLVKNSGKLSANGGIVALSAATARHAVNSVINNTGYLESKWVDRKNGKIILGARTRTTKTANAPLQKVRVSGTLDVSGKNSGETGGTVKITGEAIAITTASIDASGYAGGGTVLVGGDYQGKGDTPTSEFTFVGYDTTINADALNNGDGGKVIAWSDNTTRVYGNIFARGGALNGDGGFIETSGKDYLDVAGISINAYAFNGLHGEWLLDPTSDVYITASSSQGASVSGSDPKIFEPAASNTYISSSTIENVLNQGVDVTIKTYNGNDAGKGIIHVKDNIDKTHGSSATLTLLANTGVYLNYGYHIASTSNALNVIINADADNTNGGIVKIDSNAAYAIQTNGGFVNIRAWDHVYEGHAIKTNGGNITLRHINDDATWVTIAHGIGRDYIVDAGTGNVTLDTKYSAGGDRIEFGNYAVRANQLTIEASDITNIGQGFNYGNSEYSYTTAIFDDDDNKGELFYRGTPIIRGGADFNDIDGRTISDRTFAEIIRIERRNEDIQLLNAVSTVPIIVPQYSLNPENIALDALENIGGFEFGLNGYSEDAAISAAALSVLSYEANDQWVSDVLTSQGISRVGGQYLRNPKQLDGKDAQYLLGKKDGTYVISLRGTVIDVNFSIKNKKIGYFLKKIGKIITAPHVILSGKHLYDIVSDSVDVNIDDVKVDVNFLAIPLGKNGVKVHAGFFMRALAVYEDLLKQPEIRNSILNGTFKAQISGHSLGGSAATILTYLLNNSGGNIKPANIATYTIGAPKAGNKEFAMASSSQIYHSINKSDLVTKAGIGGFGGERAGQVKPVKLITGILASEHPSATYIQSMYQNRGKGAGINW